MATYVEVLEEIGTPNDRSFRAVVALLRRALQSVGKFTLANGEETDRLLKVRDQFYSSRYWIPSSE